jgi:hypothetical protein
MILGKDAIVISVEEARILVNELHVSWTRERIERLQKEGSLTVIDNLRTLISQADSIKE